MAFGMKLPSKFHIELRRHSSHTAAAQQLLVGVKFRASAQDTGAVLRTLLAGTDQFPGNRWSVELASAALLAPHFCACEAFYPACGQSIKCIARYIKRLHKASSLPSLFLSGLNRRVNQNIIYCTGLSHRIINLLVQGFSGFFKLFVFFTISPADKRSVGAILTWRVGSWHCNSRGLFYHRFLPFLFAAQPYWHRG